MVASTQRQSIWHKLHKTRQASPPSLFPEPWQCIVHLKLMRAFARLKVTLVNALVQQPLQDNILDHENQVVSIQSETDIRDRMWYLYLEQASLRFEAWWTAQTPKDQGGRTAHFSLSTCTTPGGLESLVENAQPFTWTEKNIPPLDVLMILHSFMLNPRCFLEDCIRFDMLPLWKAGMPWQILDKVLDTTTDDYSVSKAAIKHWEKSTGYVWDIRQGWLERRRSCPACDTTIKSKKTATVGPAAQNDDILCSTCKTTFTPEQLEVYKFHTALKNLRSHSIPLAGTILDVNGLAKSATGAEEGNYGLLVLNTRLSSGSLSEEILAMTNPKNQTTNTASTSITIQSIKTTLEQHLLYDNDTNKTDPTPHQSETKDLKTAIHRCTSQFTNNPSQQFSLSLPSAVIRQTAFIQEMERTSWLNSPSLHYTLLTLLTRYATFIQIIAENPLNVAIPTYAVDLAWHTHQLSPWSYYTYSTTETKSAKKSIGQGKAVFIDHDDRIGEGTLTNAFEWTSEQYNLLRPGEAYSDCLCWICACTKEAVAAKKHGVCDDSMSSLGVDQTRGSGHVKFVPGSALEKHVLERIGQAQYVKLEEDYGVACRLALRTGQGEVDRKRFLEGYKWLYWQAVPKVQV